MGCTSASPSLQSVPNAAPAARDLVHCTGQSRRDSSPTVAKRGPRSDAIITTVMTSDSDHRRPRREHRSPRNTTHAAHHCSTVNCPAVPCPSSRPSRRHDRGDVRFQTTATVAPDCNVMTTEPTATGPLVQLLLSGNRSLRLRRSRRFKLTRQTPARRLADGCLQYKVWCDGATHRTCQCPRWTLATRPSEGFILVRYSTSTIPDASPPTTPPTARPAFSLSWRPHAQLQLHPC